MPLVSRRWFALLGGLGPAALFALWAGAPSLEAQRIVRRYRAPVPEVVEPAAPIVRDTPTNLQAAFSGEMNAKQRYLAFADRADREGYASVARLFRACARAEQVHADEHVHAIAWAGAEARALLQKMVVGTTAENLRSAIATESYEVTQFYPALLERARADHEPKAVRSLTFALSAEREHLALLTAALASLDRRPAGGPIYVCGLCGKTVEALSFKKCPNCFTGARRFTKEG
jgi:rubrerythrin